MAISGSRHGCRDQQLGFPEQPCISARKTSDGPKQRGRHSSCSQIGTGHFRIGSDASTARLVWSSIINEGDSLTDICIVIGAYSASLRVTFVSAAIWGAIMLVMHLRIRLPRLGSKA